MQAEARWEPCYAGSYRATIDPVAIIFELVVNFGRDEDAVQLRPMNSSSIPRSKRALGTTCDTLSQTARKAAAPGA